MSRIAILLASVLLLVAPAQGQDVDSDHARRIGKLIEKLRDPRAQVRQDAARDLGVTARAAPASAFPALIEALGDEDEGVRMNAAFALRGFGAQAVSAVPALIQALGDEDEGVRMNAAVALEAIGPQAAPAIPALIQALSEQSGTVRDNASRALGAIGSPAVPALAQALGSDDVTVRRHAAGALTAGGPSASPAVPALVVALADDDLKVRDLAAIALKEIGPQAAPAIPALIKASGDESPWPTEALQEIGTGLKAQGTVLLWVLPRAYWKGLLGLSLLLTAWFCLAARLRHRPTNWPKRAAFFALVFTPPAILACKAVHYALTREWAQGFLPDLPLTQLPLPMAAVLSVGFCMVLATVLTTHRKPERTDSEPAGPVV